MNKGPKARRKTGEAGKSQGSRPAQRATRPAKPTRQIKARTPAKGSGAPKSQAVAKSVVTTFVATPRPRVKSAAAAIRKRSPKDTAGLQAVQLVELYRYLFETRRLEETIVALYRQNKVVGGVYTSLGQEGTAVGCAYAMRDGDFVQPLIRDVGAMLVHGASPLALFRQYMARGTGPSAGRDLNTHFSDPKVGILGPVSMLGAMVPVLAGCLLAARLKGEPRAGLAFIGDGGSSTGAFYEGMNFAAVQRLPLIVVIEANGYAYSTPTSVQVPHGDLLARARGFGCTVAQVDGNDTLACYQAAKEARARGLAGEGSTIVVAETYRRKGHAEHDNQAYVPPGEIDDWAENNDPLSRFNAFLLQGKHADEPQLVAVRAAVEAELATARDTAEAEPFPAATTLTYGVFDDGHQPCPQTSTWFRGGPAHRA